MNMPDEITVTLPDGSTKTVAAGTTGLDLAASIGRRLAKDAVAIEVDGELVDLTRPLPPDADVEIVTGASETGRHVLRHSTAHVMAQAVTQLFPGAKYSIGPAIEDGFYYDFDLPGGQTFHEDDLGAITTRMREIVAADQPFVRSELSADDALELFADQPYKGEIIERAANAKADAADAGEVSVGGTVSVYRNTPEFADLCLGPHVPSTGRLGHFQLRRVAGAYWRGDEKRPMLQRIYGTAWESDAALKEYLHRLEEAEKRDHRRLAVDLDLLSFPEELGGGLVVWHPKGAIVRKVMEDYSRERHIQGGYEFVYTPHLSKAGLFETSGHLDWYAESMYPPMEMDNGVYYPKPMNCPMHCLIYRSRQRSYRELPLRLFELGTVYRYERAGVLHGLLRVRGFTQDDAHIFCTAEQLPEELTGALDFVLSVLRAFGFTDFVANLSTRDPAKSIGAEDDWEYATDTLRAVVEKAGLPYETKEGDAAFYGPKIDIDVRDAIGRYWQLSTVQFDFNLPERFGLEYVGADNARHRPYMVHRALFGSVERFFGVLLEHYAGALPTWLAPVQVRVLPVSDGHDAFAQRLADRLRALHYRADVVEATDQLGKRIRAAKLEKIPYVLVVGDDDVEHGTVGVNPRGGDVERGVPVDTFLERLAAAVLVPAASS
jgi:threonyl-tRNA synthetase